MTLILACLIKNSGARLIQINRHLGIFVAVVCAGTFYLAVLLRALSDVQTFLVSDRYQIFYLFLPIVGLLVCARFIVSRSIFFASLALAPAILLYVTELGLAYAEASRFTSKAARISESSLFSEIVSRRFKGQDVYPFLSPSHLMLSGDFVNSDFSSDKKSPNIFPFAGLPNTDTIYCNELGYWADYKSDRYGFNNPDYVWDEVEHSVMLVGDSFAQGACVARDRTIASRMRAKLVGDNIISLGVGGTGPLLTHRVLEHFGPRIKPKIVFWLFYEGNDLHINIPIEVGFLVDEEGSTILKSNDWNTEAIGYYKSYINSLIESSRRTDRQSTEVRGMKFSDTLKLIRVRDHLGLTSCPRKGSGVLEFRRVLQQGSNLIKSLGAKLEVIYLPASGSSNGCDFFDGGKSSSWIKKAVRAVTTETGVGFSDFSEVFKPEFSSAPGKHYTEEGYNALADFLVSRMYELGTN